MLHYLLFLYSFSKLTFASLLPPEDPYSDDEDQNYLYEQACHQSAFEHSSRYECPIVRTKMFHTFYLECLTTIWPRCEVAGARNMWIAHPLYNTFKINDVLTQDVRAMPFSIAHKSGFPVGELLEPRNNWFIFWHPSRPKTNIERFNKIKFATINDLYNTYLKNITDCITKFQNAGIEESPDKLYITQEFGSEHRRIIDFKRFNVIVMSSLISMRVSSPSSKSANDKANDLDQLLNKHLPIKTVKAYLFSKHFPEQHIHLFYPLHTVIKPGFPYAIHYLPSKMKHLYYTRHQKHRSFIVALFDENGNFVDDPKKGFTSYLVIYFSSIKSE